MACKMLMSLFLSICL